MSGVGLKKAWKKQLARYTSALKYSAAISKNTKLSFKIKGTVTYKKIWNLSLLSTKTRHDHLLNLLSHCCSLYTYYSYVLFLFF